MAKNIRLYQQVVTFFPEHVNIQLPKQLTGKSKTQISVYIYIEHHIRGQWNSPISPQTVKTPFLDSYICHVTCLPNIRPSCLTTMNHPPKTLQ